MTIDNTDPFVGHIVQFLEKPPIFLAVLLSTNYIQYPMACLHKTVV